MNEAEIGALQPYFELMLALTSGRLTPVEFQASYLRAYKTDPFLWSDSTFAVLDHLFGDVDAYVSDQDLRDVEDLGDDDLRESVRRSTLALHELVS